MAATEVKMKLMVDTKSQKVLFAEVGKESVDFLFDILSLPIGTVIWLLNNKDMVGSIANIYSSIENLNQTYLQPHQTKEILLKPSLPASSSSSLLFLPHDVPTTIPEFLYMCSCSGDYSTVSDSPNDECLYCERERTIKVQYVPPPGGNTLFQIQGRVTVKNLYICHEGCDASVSVGPKARCLNCGKKMSKKAEYIGKTASAEKTLTPSKDGGIVKGVVTYMVMDNLEVKPMSTISSIMLLNQFNVKDVCALEEKAVTLTTDKALKLLKLSLKSNTVLTDVFLH